MTYMPTGILPAIRKMKDFEKGLQTSSDWVVFLDSRLSQLKSLVEYLRREVKPDGILSTRGSIIRLSAKIKNKLILFHWL